MYFLLIKPAFCDLNFEKVKKARKNIESKKGIKNNEYSNIKIDLRLKFDLEFY